MASKPPPKSETGTCQMCGRHNQELTLTVFWNFFGFACRYCVEEMKKESIGRIKASTEHTEPSE